MAISQNELKQRADRLYDLYAKPLEREHLGEFVAISTDGRTLLGSDLYELVAQATSKLGRGNFIFKIGERAVGKIR